MIDKSLQDLQRKIARLQEIEIRQAKTMLAGFIATEEHDIDYMDQHIDNLLDFVDSNREAESLIRKYYDHIASFDPEEAKDKLDSLEDDLGYKTMIVYAAGLLAKELHSGQQDKGGSDYVKLHLVPVATVGYGWKEKVVGFLHDALEDTPISIDELIDALYKKTAEIESEDESEWWQPWMEEVTSYPNETTHILTEEEKQEIQTALNLLNKNHYTSREEYLARIATNHLALKVKLNDLRSNMDPSRIPNPTDKDLARIERYKQEYSRLLNTLS